MIRFTGAFTALALLAGCGLKGPLEPAPPMWGQKDREASDAPELVRDVQIDGDDLIFGPDDVRAGDRFDEDEFEGVSAALQNLTMSPDHSSAKSHKH